MARMLFCYCVLFILLTIKAVDVAKPPHPSFTVTHLDSTRPTPAVPPRRRLKILISNPIMGWSHSQFLGAMADALADAGHEVHMFTFVVNTEMNNYIGAKRIRTLIRHERPPARANDLMDSNLADTFFVGPRNSVWSGEWQAFASCFADVCKELVDNRPLIQYLKEQKYDFAISEPYSTCMFGLFKLAEVRSTAVTVAIPLSSLVTSAFGIPGISSFVSDVWSSNMVDPLKMSWWQRAKNFLEDVYIRSHRDINIRMEQPLFDAAFGAAAPSLRSALRNASLAFVNSHDMLSMPRPISTKIVNIGGIAAKDDQTTQLLPEKLTAAVESGRKGAVLFSFGTFISTRRMSPELRATFVDAFAKFPDYAFIWKFDPIDNLTINVGPNVHLFEWVPQKALLAHPRLRAFISHCGLNSANEAAKAGVPVLGIPLFADQTYNAALLDNKGLSLNVNVAEVRRRGSVVIENALRRLLTDERYVQTGRVLKRKIALTPFPARERLVKWVEFAAEFPDLNELNMPTDEEMPPFAYYSIDVTCALAAAFVIAAVAIFIVALVARRFVPVILISAIKSLSQSQHFSKSTASRKKIN